MLELSIVVPIYNVEKYLKTCIDSILLQTFVNFELILVNDGSTDRSGQICDEYLKKDNRIVVIHKKNGGLSSARNAGIDIAKGTYIGFVDSDDYISENMYELLLNNIKNYDASISICGRVLFKRNDDLIKLINDYKYKAGDKYVLSNEDALKKLFYFDGLDMSACDKLYKKELFDTIRFPNNKISEDTFIMYKLFSKSNKVIIDLANEGYYYRQREGSITKTKFSKNDFDGIVAAIECMEYMKHNHPSIESNSKAFFYSISLSTTNKYIRYPNDELDEDINKIILMLRKNLKNIIFDSEINKNTKIMILILAFNKRIYEMLYKLYVKCKK